jgi:hypothetical protein
MLYDKELEYSPGKVGASCSTSDDHGNVYISGSIVITDELQWPFVTRIDSCGNKVWCKILDFSFEGFNEGWAQDIIKTNTGEIIILSILKADDQYELIHLIALDSYGNVLWRESYASKYDYPWILNQVAYSIEEINHEYYISGNCYWPYPNDTNHVFLRPMFIGIDSLFNEKWVLPFYAQDSVFGNAYCSIKLSDSIIMGLGKRRLPDNEVNSLLMFYSINGDELGYTQIQNDQIGPTIKRNHIRMIERINETNFLVGVYYGPENYGNPAGEFVIDTAANVYNFQSHPNTSSASLLKTYDNNYVFATSIEETKGDKDIYIYKIDDKLEPVPFDPTPHTYDSLCPGGIQSGNTSLDDCLVWTNVGDAPSPGQYYESIRWIPVKAYPNPVKGGKVTFEFENTDHHYNMELIIYNNTGFQIHSQKIYKGQQDTDVNVSGWNKGVYIAVIYSNGGAVGKCKFVVG